MRCPASAPSPRFAPPQPTLEQLRTVAPGRGAAHRRGATRMLRSVYSRVSLTSASRAAPRAVRFLSSDPSLEERMEELVPVQQAKMKDLLAKYGDKELCNVTVSQVIGGMRGLKSLYTETSVLDTEKGIRFRGFTIEELEAKLPRAPGGTQPLPEGLFWLLLTGEIPTETQVRRLSRELYERSEVPDHVLRMINGFPTTMHPMTQFSAAVLGLQTESVFAQAYERGESKKLLWKHALEDSLNLLARLPVIAARIYRNSFQGGAMSNLDRAPDESLDWSANFTKMLNVNSTPEFEDVMRMYFVVHADHEGGNVSAHSTHLVGSTLADPYLSYSAGLNGLAGPLHGLANQEVLRWIMNFREQYGDDLSQEKLKAALWDTLNKGNVIPGYGHAVLRRTDPRFTSQHEFSKRTIPDDPLVKLVDALYEVAPGVLKEHGKAKNPYPNVDAHSGVLLHHYGMKEPRFYTVLFGVSRALGCLASLVLDRSLMLPLERPKSLDMASIEAHFK